MRCPPTNAAPWKPKIRSVRPAGNVLKAPQFLDYLWKVVYHEILAVPVPNKAKIVGSGRGYNC